MSSRKLFYVLLAIIVLINGGAVAALVLGDKQLAKQNTKLTELKVESATLDKVQQSLVTAQKDIDTYSPIEQIVKTVVPQEKDQAKTVREIVKLAAESKIAISSVTFPSSTLGTKTTGIPGQATTSTSSVTQTQKVDGITNVERLEITVTSDPAKPVLFTDFLSFLNKLEQNRRTSQVSSINIQPGSENRNRLTFSLVLNVYIKK